jgi:predicted house-cleaning noncanonical NTP pyrophosphatase (MazG superfamily)
MDDTISQQIDYDMLIENVYNTVKLQINIDDFCTSDMIEIIPVLISVIETIKNLNGLDKKTVCMLVLRRIVNRTSYEDDEKRATLLKFVNENASKMIDIIVFAANGKMFLKKASNFSKRVFDCMRCC